MPMVAERLRASPTQRTAWHFVCNIRDVHWVLVTAIKQPFDRQGRCRVWGKVTLGLLGKHGSNARDLMASGACLCVCARAMVIIDPENAPPPSSLSYCEAACKC